MSHGSNTSRLTGRVGRSEDALKTTRGLGSSCGRFRHRSTAKSNLFARSFYARSMHGASYRSVGLRCWPHFAQSQNRKACTPAIFFRLLPFLGLSALCANHRLLISSILLICGRITLINSEKSLFEISPHDVLSGRPSAIAMCDFLLKFAVLRNRRTVRTECASIKKEFPVKTTQSFSRATLSRPTLSIAFASHPNSTTSDTE